MVCGYPPNSDGPIPKEFLISRIEKSPDGVFSAIVNCGKHWVNVLYHKMHGTVHCRIIENLDHSDFSQPLYELLVTRGFHAALEIKSWPVRGYRCGYLASFCNLVATFSLGCHCSLDEFLAFDPIRMRDPFELFVVEILKNKARGIFIDLPLELQKCLRTGIRRILFISFVLRSCLHS